MNLNNFCMLDSDGEWSYLQGTYFNALENMLHDNQTIGRISAQLAVEDNLLICYLIYKEIIDEDGNVTDWQAVSALPGQVSGAQIREEIKQVWQETLNMTKNKHKISPALQRRYYSARNGMDFIY